MMMGFCFENVDTFLLQKSQTSQRKKGAFVPFSPRAPSSFAFSLALF